MPMPPPPGPPIAPYLVSVERVTLNGVNTSQTEFVLKNNTTGGSVAAITSNESNSNIIINLADASGDIWEVGDVIQITATKGAYSTTPASHTIADADNEQHDFGTISITGGSITTEISTYPDQLYELYELNHTVQITATSPTLTVTGVLPHADVIASTGYKLDFTRVYVNGVAATVTEIAASGADTVITVSDTIVSGDTVDIFFATSTGTMQNNTALGKIPATCDQLVQNYVAQSAEIDVGGCGTDRYEPIRFSDDGVGTLAFKQQGNANMQNFILAIDNKTYLMIVVKNSNVPGSPTYDILHECRITKIGRSTQARSAKTGLIVDLVNFDFVPPVKVTS